MTQEDLTRRLAQADAALAALRKATRELQALGQSLLAARRGRHSPR
jgi:hypothetical protein